MRTITLVCGNELRPQLFHHPQPQVVLPSRAQVGALHGKLTHLCMSDKIQGNHVSLPSRARTGILHGKRTNAYMGNTATQQSFSILQERDGKEAQGRDFQCNAVKRLVGSFH